MVCRLPWKFRPQRQVLGNEERRAAAVENVFEETLQEAGYEVESVDSPERLRCGQG